MVGNKPTQKHKIFCWLIAEALKHLSSIFNMKLYVIIGYLSNIIWTLIPFFVVRKKYFLFFLVLAANGMMSFLAYSTLHIPANIFWIPFHYLLIFTLSDTFFKKHYLYILAGFIPFVLLGYFATHEERRLFLIFVHGFILIWFLWNAIKTIIVNNKFDLFLLLMSLYEFIMIFKLIAMLGEVQLGMEVFYTGSAMQILIGLYLIFVRKDIIIQLKKDNIPLEQ